MPFVHSVSSLSLFLVTLCLLSVVNLWAEPPLPIPVIKGKVVAKIAFGEGKFEIPRPGFNSVGEGIPTAFLATADGRKHVLIPHERSIIVISPQGKAERKIYLTQQGGKLLRKDTFLFDMVFDEQGNYAVLEKVGGTIMRFDTKGNVTSAFGTFVAADAIEKLSTGGFAVRDPGCSAVNLFDDGGRFLGYVKDDNLSALSNGKGAFARVVLLFNKRALVWLRPQKGTFPRLFAGLETREKGAKLYETTPVGFLADGDLLLLTTEQGAKGYCSYLIRLRAGGKVKGLLRLPATMEFASSIPRFWRLTPDNKVLGFRTSEKYYRLISYDVPGE